MSWPSLDLRRAAVATPVMGDDAIALAEEEQHLRVPVVRRRAASRDGTRSAARPSGPSPCEDFDAVFGGYSAHGIDPLAEGTESGSAPSPRSLAMSPLQIANGSMRRIAPSLWARGRAAPGANARDIVTASFTRRARWWRAVRGRWCGWATSRAYRVPMRWRSFQFSLSRAIGANPDTHEKCTAFRAAQVGGSQHSAKK